MEVRVSARWEATFNKVMDRILVASRVPELGACWEWQGPDNATDGYPRMSLDGVTVAVHRVMFVAFNGYLPPKKHVDHLCRNRCCVRPEHLEAVTHRENQRRKKRAKPIAVTGQLVAYFPLTSELQEWVDDILKKTGT